MPSLNSGSHTAIHRRSQRKPFALLPRIQRRIDSTGSAIRFVLDFRSATCYNVIDELNVRSKAPKVIRDTYCSIEFIFIFYIHSSIRWKCLQHRLHIHLQMNACGDMYIIPVKNCIALKSNQYRFPVLLEVRNKHQCSSGWIIDDNGSVTHSLLKPNQVSILN